MKKSKAEQIYESIRQEIDHNPPGTRLGSIRSLMRRYHTSQFSITGAIRKLEEDRILHRTPKGELLVRPQGEPAMERIGIWMPDWPSPVHTFSTRRKSAVKRFGTALKSYVSITRGAIRSGSSKPKGSAQLSPSCCTG